MVYGARVVIVPSDLPGKWEPECYRGLYGYYNGTNASGYVRVRLERGGAVLVHPESIQVDNYEGLSTCLRCRKLTGVPGRHESYCRLNEE